MGDLMMAKNSDFSILVSMRYPQARRGAPLGTFVAVRDCWPFKVKVACCARNLPLAEGVPAAPKGSHFVT